MPFTVLPGNTSPILQMRCAAGCPPKCQTCTAHVKSHGNDLTLEEIKLNIDFFIREYGITELVFSGKEITTRKDFPEIIQFIKEKNLRLVTMLSGGVHWPARQVELAAGVISRVVVAFTPISESESRNGKATLKKITGTIELLQQHAIKVETNTILTRYCIAQLKDVADLLIQLGIQNPTLTFPFALGKTQHDFSKVLPWKQAEKIVLNALDKLQPLGVRLKNVPLCQLGPHRNFAKPTTQRILVEPGRQLLQHAMIPPFPGLEKNKACEGCSLKNLCDGYWPAYVDAKIFSNPMPSWKNVSEFFIT
jgi:hypothetical protein